MESFSVKAILSATDKGFSSTLKNAMSSVQNLGSTLKSGIGFGILTGIGQQAFSSITSGVSDLIGEVDSSNASWKTFRKNLQIVGKSDKYIDGVEKSLKSYAEQTVYSSSDMATTFAQLEAVGVKSADKLVMGFGGLAAAAENPQQAMKTLSQQATQMAAKPNVAWQDFKLMLEQTPAGIAAVAKEMGMTTSELVTKIQDGEVATDDFFDAINKVGTSKEFSELATEAKTVGQAMDGLKETMANKLGPAFDVVSQRAIGFVETITDKIGGIDSEGLAKKVTGFLDKAAKYFDAFKEAFSGVGGEFKEALTAIGQAFTGISGEFGSTESIDSFKSMMQSVADFLKKIANFATEHADGIAKLIKLLPALVLGFKGFQIVKTVAPFITTFAGGIAKLAGKGIGAIAGKLFGIAGSQKAVGTAAQASNASILKSAQAFALMGVAVLTICAGLALLAQSAIALASAGPLAIGVMVGLLAAVVGLGIGMAVLLKTLAPMGAQLVPVATAFLMMGAAVLLVAAGFALLAYSAIQVSNAGGTAIAVMFGMIAAIAGLAAVFAFLGPALTAGAIGMIAFGAAVLLVGAGVLLACAGLSLLAAQLPTIVTYGAQAAAIILQLSVALLTFAAGALAGGAAAIVLGAGTLVAAAGMIAFGAGVLVASAGLLAMKAGLMMVNSSMKSIAKNAKTTQKSLTSMKKSIKVVESGLDALGNKAKSAMNKLKSAFDSTASKAQSAGKKVGNGFATGMKAGLTKAQTAAKTATTQITTALTSAATKATAAGLLLGTGFATGSTSGFRKAVSAASSAVSSVNARLRSGRSGAYSAGAYISMGFAQGMRSQLGAIQSAANAMVKAANKAIQAKAKIHSPSDVTDKYGTYYGKGWVNGILGMVKAAWNAAEELVSFPQVATPNLALAYGGELSADYDYSRKAEYNITVISELDGKEVGKGTAKYVEDEMNKKATRDSRKKGKA